MQDIAAQVASKLPLLQKGIDALTRDSALTTTIIPSFGGVVSSETSPLLVATLLLHLWR
jgi:hypothetical protein